MDEYDPWSYDATKVVPNKAHKVFWLKRDIKMFVLTVNESNKKKRFLNLSIQYMYLIRRLSA